jgi:ADP-dependent NAD(P)H-hydrate dehydratase / NAD(P)H-hydrate epimerase
MSIPVISIAQMREWEKASWAAGKSEADVIRQVGNILAREALQLTKPGDTILILAGKGHNGDDARCAREHLHDRRVETLDVKNAEGDFPKLDALLRSRPALIIDGLFGIGINRPLDASWVKFIERINAAKLPVLAVDTPSGLNADSGEPQGAAIEAAVTLTVGAPKIGLVQHHATRYVGQLIVAQETGLMDCPYQSDLNWTAPEDFSGFPPRRPVAGHKGTFGHLAILAGSLGYHGAAVLASRGAQRAQPGLITLFTQERAYVPIAAQLQAVMVHLWSPKIELPGKFSAVLVGPGLASPDVPEELKETARRLWREATVPVIADASALDWLPTGSIPKNAIRVLTPHPGEAARLLKTNAAEVQSHRPEALRKISQQLGNAWVVLKGHQTLIGRAEDLAKPIARTAAENERAPEISSPSPPLKEGEGRGEEASGLSGESPRLFDVRRSMFDVRCSPIHGEEAISAQRENAIFINSSGNPFLGQGGSGDTLSGYLAGLLAQPALQADPPRTIRFAVWQHGASADLLTRTHPNWIVEDLLNTLGSAR